ncbi:MAG: L-histidine N(alpha)-methyltransferase [Sporocytophaga sp.]|uniref:L-histidine N(alpha)-methyltransferase n=1 Tax=Sporocytophaga sp. TaxID=2231183 RepID=UPI001B040612|nr:L-histidine N(alpha)-methyltransferase [Sporocytophaga sp.]MBO9703782.1 L-histidine N(alpha)-methyltransferase [Sporocytophaga sp.]
MDISDIVKTISQENFAEDLIKGLSSIPKYLPSRYLYDDKGDVLFQKIMNLEEYYLTRAEFQILQNNKEDLLDYFIHYNKPFDLIELGAGDGLKTRILLKFLTDKNAAFQYIPVDISGNILKLLSSELRKEFPDLVLKPHCNDYFSAMSELRKFEGKRKVVLFMGGNIGNFSLQESINFYNELNKSLLAGDLVLTGFDLKKDPRLILKAYDDSEGITAKFNLNLLERINKEFSGDFKTENFSHFPYYDPTTGECKSFLLSTVNQSVRLKALDLNISFRAWESIQTEVSKKYSENEIEALADLTGFAKIHNFYDDNKYFTDSLWVKK